MSHAHRRRAEAFLLLLAALFLLAATLVVGCSGQSANYEGTWVQKPLPNSGPQTPLVIEKVGENYKISSQNGEASGYVLHSDPSGGKFAIRPLMLTAGSWATQDGSKLKLSSGQDTVEITVSGDTMTMVFPGSNDVYTFSRVAAK